MVFWVDAWVFWLVARVFCSVVTKVVLSGCQVFTGLFWLVARYFLTVSNKMSH